VRSLALPLALLTALPAVAQDEDLDLGEEPGEPVVEESAATDAGSEPSGTDLTSFDRIRAVSRKTFLKAGRFELTPMGGFSTNDAFYRHWTVGARASYHLVDSLALEIGGAWNAWQQELEPIGFLRRTQNAITDNATVYGYGDVGLTFAPVYGKVSVLSNWIWHFDAFVSGGVGTVIDSNASVLAPGVLPALHPSFNVGVGARVFLLDWLVVRVGLRDYIYPQDRRSVSAVQTLLLFNVGVGIYFPFGFKYENVAFKVVG
jgi:outer membrane beta-barrel protein